MCDQGRRCRVARAWARHVPCMCEHVAMGRPECARFVLAFAEMRVRGTFHACCTLLVGCSAVAAAGPDWRRGRLTSRESLARCESSHQCVLWAARVRFRTPVVRGRLAARTGAVLTRNSFDFNAQ